MNVIATAAEVAKTRRRAPWSATACVLCVVAVWAAVYLPGLFRPPLLDDADSVHAEAAREMALSGDWVTLHADGVRYLEKAPLMYWTIAASFTVFGVHEWSARLPLALGVLALLLCTWSLGRRVYGAAGGLFAAIVLATCFGPYIFTRFLIPDLLVGLWLLLTFDCFVRTLEEGAVASDGATEMPAGSTAEGGCATRSATRAACWGLAIACALNVLTKGLIGLVFPAAVIGAYLLLTRNLRHLLRMRLVSSTLVFLAVAAPWHVLAGLRNPAQGNVRGFFWFYFVNEHFLRYLNKRVPRDYDTVPLLLFWGLMLVWLLPWCAFLPQAVATAWRSLRETVSHARAAGAAELHRANVVFGLWAVVILAFFSFSTRQEYYVLPAVPALALLIGGWLGEEGAQPAAVPHDPSAVPHGSRAGRFSAAGLMVAGLAAGVISMVLAAGARTPPPGSDIADLLTRNPDKYALSFGHFFDLTGPALGAFRVPLLGVGLSLMAGGFATWLLRRRGRPFEANLALAAAMVVMLAFVHQGFVIFSPTITSKELALAIERQIRPEEIIVIDGDYEDGSTLNFYTGRHVRVLNHREANLWYGSFWPDAPRVFETDESLLALWKSPLRIYLWSQVRQPVLLRGLPVYEVARGGGKYILSNR